MRTWWLMGGLLALGGCATAQAGSAPADPAPEQSPLLGVVRTRDMRLELRAGDQGARYTVTARDGRVLARDLNSGELAERYGELDHVVRSGMAQRPSAPYLDATLSLPAKREPLASPLPDQPKLP